MRSAALKSAWAGLVDSANRAKVPTILWHEPGVWVVTRIPCHVFLAAGVPLADQIAAFDQRFPGCIGWSGSGLGEWEKLLPSNVKPLTAEQIASVPLGNLVSPNPVLA